MGQRFLVEATDPTGAVFYVAYGPMVTDPTKASKFVSESVAQGVIRDYRGHGTAFWESEKASAKRMAKEYKDWTFKVLPATETQGV